MDESEQSRRVDNRVAEKVECGIALMAIRGKDEALRYLRNCGVPPDVIGRVLGSPIARRAHGAHLADRRRENRLDSLR